MRTTEHFDWAIGRALEYVDQGDAGNAMASLVSDLSKHEGTAGILTEDLMFLFAGEVMLGGAQGAKRFIEGLPRPADRADPVTRPQSFQDRLDRDHAALGGHEDVVEPSCGCCGRRSAPAAGGVCCGNTAPSLSTDGES